MHDVLQLNKILIYKGDMSHQDFIGRYVYGY